MTLGKESYLRIVALYADSLTSSKGILNPSKKGGGEQYHFVVCDLKDAAGMELIREYRSIFS